MVSGIAIVLIEVMLILWVLKNVGLAQVFHSLLFAPVDAARALYRFFAYDERFIWLQYVALAWVMLAIGYLVRTAAAGHPFVAIIGALVAATVYVALSEAVKQLKSIPVESKWHWLGWMPSLQFSTASWAHAAGVSNADRSKVRGAGVIEGHAAAREKQAIAARTDLGLNIFIAGMPIDYDVEPQHFLIGGRTGAGKTQAINSMLRTIRLRIAAGMTQSVIVADPGFGYYMRFAQPGDVLLNPFDDRSAAWSPFAELEDDYDCQRIAAAAIPDASGEARQWHYYAQTLFAEVLRALWMQGNHSTKELLRLVMSADLFELAEVVKGTPAEQLAQKSNDRMLASTRAVAASYLNAWTYLPDRGDFSVRAWTRQAGVGSAPWLFLPYQDSQMAMLRNLVAAWLELAIVEGLSLSEDRERRIWYILDELDTLGKVTSLRGGLTKLRKYGGVCVAGLQTMAQLRDTYGNDESQVLLSCMVNKLVLSLADGDTAEYFSKEIGDREVIRTVVSSNSGSSSNGQFQQSTSSGTSHAQQYQTERAVLPAEITRLNDLNGYLKRSNIADWQAVNFPYEVMPDINEKHDEHKVKRRPAMALAEPATVDEAE